MQRAVQAAIDLATHVVATEGHGLAAAVAENFTLLEQQGVIDPQLALRLRKMVGFRTIAVHNYQALNLDIVEAIVTRHLGDLRAFSAVIAQRFRL